jgi:cysteine desulfurase/selenocysteine lyase
LDSAATSLKPIAVIKKIEEYYTKYSTNPHNNDSSIASKVNQDIKKVRSNISNFFNVEQNEIVFTSGATDGLNLIQSNVIK